MCRVAPGLLSDLMQDSRVTVGGGDAVLSFSAVAKPVEHVLYVKATELQEIIADFFVANDTNDPNVAIYAVDDVVWPGGRTVRRAVAIVDLIDQGDMRSASEVLKEFG
jgi:hypothetical protein